MSCSIQHLAYCANLLPYRIWLSQLQVAQNLKFSHSSHLLPPLAHGDIRWSEAINAYHEISKALKEFWLQTIKCALVLHADNCPSWSRNCSTDSYRSSRKFVNDNQGIRCSRLCNQSRWHAFRDLSSNLQIDRWKNGPGQRPRSKYFEEDS